jgi:7-cyano-7-deazaguanine synthase in queuosine biosynthesis
MSMRGSDLVFSYNNYQYRVWEDCDDDCIKIFHECYRDGERITMPTEFYNHTPYSLMSREEFVKHVQTVEVFIQG